jgi:hypothetical protein
MSTPVELPPQNLALTQAIELCLLVDSEARWENLRKPRLTPADVPAAVLQNLHAKQGAYESFRSKLAAYNRKYLPAHIPELLLNKPTRLEIWCKRMRDLYRQVETNSRVPCPVHLLEKAYRCADDLAVRISRAPFSRSIPLDTIQTAVRELDALARWCDELARIAS